jgi:hypothetical protein
MAADPASDDCFSIVSKWLKERLSGHDSCPQDTEAVLSERVIDVGPWNGLRGPDLCYGYWSDRRVVSTEPLLGKALSLRTMISALDERLTGIVMANLPRTFQDEVIITRCIGYRCFWIDPLCIIQD